MTKKIYYCDINNFGDQLNKELFIYYRHCIRHASPSEADIVAIGSVLEKFSYQFNGLILGSGFMFRSSSSCFPSASIIGVRGNLTRARTFAPKNTILGDPGLLSSNLFTDSKKEFDLGIIPHYVDKEDNLITSLKRENSGRNLIIDVMQSPEMVISEITKCAAIASSSLHGLIVADAFRIPSIWINISKKVSGDGFKFRDYYSAFDEDVRCLSRHEIDSTGKIISAARTRSSKIYKIQDDLDTVFRKIDLYLNEHKARQENYIDSKYYYFKRKLHSKIVRSFTL